MRPKPADRRRMSELRSELFRLQQIVDPAARDARPAAATLLENLPGLERDVARHPFRDVHDDLVVTANQIAYLREVLSEAVNVLINQMASRLTIVATIFLPLTFATGFFGMNFGWMVRPHRLRRVLPGPRRGWDDPAADRRRRAAGALRLPPRAVGFPTPAERGRTEKRAGLGAKRKMAVDLTQVANVEAEPGELPGDHGRLGHPPGARGRARRRLPGRGDRGARARRLRGHRPRHGRRRELQQRLGGARQAGLGLPLPPRRGPPHRRLGRLGRRLEGRARGHALEARRRGRRALQPGLLRGPRGPRPRSAGRALAADLGLRDELGLVRAVHQGPGAAAAAQARRTSRGRRPPPTG